MIRDKNNDSGGFVYGNDGEGKAIGAGGEDGESRGEEYLYAEHAEKSCGQWLQRLLQPGPLGL